MPVNWPNIRTLAANLLIRLNDYRIGQDRVSIELESIIRHQPVTLHLLAACLYQGLKDAENTHRALRQGPAVKQPPENDLGGHPTDDGSTDDGEPGRPAGQLENRRRQH